MGWTNILTQKIILFVGILFLTLYLIFPTRIYGIEWILGAFIILLLIVGLINLFSKNWLELSEGKFIYNLFIVSFLSRLFAMLILLWISYSVWDMFYVVGAKDEMVYYRIGNDARLIWSEFSLDDAFSYIFMNYKSSISDSGYTSFLMILMHFIGNFPILIKTLLCFIGTITVIRGYQLARLVMELKTARLAALFLMLYPVSWFYSSVMLKEGLMVFMITEILLQTVKLQRSFKFSSLLGTLLLIIILFFFRSAISILLAIVVGFSMFIQYRKKNLVRNLLIGLVIVSVYVYFLKSTGKYEDYYAQYSDINEFTEQRLNYMETINPYVAIAGTPVFVALAFIGPFPSLVTVPVRDDLPHNEYYYHVAGNIFWIVLAFFSIYGVYYAIRFNRITMAPLWAFIIGYQIVLLKAMMFTSVRYSFPAKPFLLIMAAYGIYHLRNRKLYQIYLAFALIMIVAWNYVRLMGRG